MMERSLTGSTPPSTCVMSSSSKARVTWKMASHALMLDKKALPKPCPSAAPAEEGHQRDDKPQLITSIVYEGKQRSEPLTRPAISTTFKKAGTLEAGFQWSQSQSYRSSGTGHLKKKKKKKKKRRKRRRKRKKERDDDEEEEKEEETKEGRERG